MNMQGQHVLVVGLGASGMAMARWCASAGAHITVLDDRAAPPQAATLSQDLPDAHHATGAHREGLVRGSRLAAARCGHRAP